MHTPATTPRASAPAAQTNEVTLTVTVPAAKAHLLAHALRRAGHTVEDTGRRVTTEEGLDAEAVLEVRLREER